MIEQGYFDVELEPQLSDAVPAGRMIIDKTYFGDMQGKGVGQMLSKRVDGGASVYFAIEEFSGSIGGKQGTVTLVHKGYMDNQVESLSIELLAGSGTGELSGITGSMELQQKDGKHLYRLTWE